MKRARFVSTCVLFVYHWNGFLLSDCRRREEKMAAAATAAEADIDVVNEQI